MDRMDDRACQLRAHLDSPDGNKVLRLLQIIVAAMLLGCLVVGLGFGLLFQIHAENQPAPVQENVPQQAERLPVLGIASAVVAVGGLIFGTLMLGQRRQANLACLRGEAGMFDPGSILQASMVAWLAAAAMREGPIFLALLFAMVSDGQDRTLCLAIALAVFVWWCFHLPTRRKFSVTLGLD